MARKKNNLISLSLGELEKELAGLKESVRVIRFKAEGAKSKNVKELANLKKSIARVLTRMAASKKK